MQIDAWLQAHADSVNWLKWRGRWEAMLRRYNPWCDEQQTVLCGAAGLDPEADALVVDLGCGPGSTMEAFLRESPQAHVIGIDSDPLYLTMAERSLTEYAPRFQLLRADLREPKWVNSIPGPVDAVVSHTSLHWLLPENLKSVFRSSKQILRPGGLFLNADHIRCSSEEAQAMAGRVQESLQTQREEGQDPLAESWDEYHRALRTELGLGSALDEWQDEKQLWEGSDDGYGFDFYRGALSEAGFESVELLWRVGTRGVVVARNAL